MIPPPTPSTHHKIRPPTSASLYQTSSSLAPLIYKDCTSFTNYMSSTPSNNIFSSDLWKYPITTSSYSSSLFQFQDGGSMMSRYCYPSSRKENMLIFGTSTEASCSSSDCSYNGTKEIKQEDYLPTLQSCCYNNISSPTGFEEDNKKFMLMSTYHDNDNNNNNNNNGSGQNVNQQYWTDKAANGFYGESANPVLLDYDAEDVNNINSSSSSFNFIEENKTVVDAEKTMYYNYYN
ncbi:putative Myb domain protein 36 [Tripterygium wilfordii]|uniref:Putative Myb domain protein 36 n=2 Tax=Tripterygium wilfordii TaxID=458696 RepID=A0A7J7DEQ6_TRIWF|nr:putative Myb domain protein 36 [Tripterygium wilfordii]